ncbi:erythromycin esterase family protein [Phytoactinopolyspora halotolerans]|uniref:Erythromycin esterase family protein n=1 Tax=Phytoactinopolyspora halotolerans TaxID=1981512 RepID=A0A6L9SAY0_9ACTN|nr:erythromycin esterase family protein [Phytoactinopolyspora halotolerans]NEE02515.1 erythromycin esterase family protein [Phytoactinopolyspora halotolerans]
MPEERQYTSEDRTGPGAGVITRRGVLRAASAGAALGAMGSVAPGFAVPAPAAEDRAASVVRSWLDRTARPLAGTDPALPTRDLRALDRLVRRAAVIGLGESAHGTHDQFVLKHRLIRHLVREHGVRTVAWEDAWGACVPVDRYITGGVGDPRAVLAQAGYNLQNTAMLDLMAWLRAFNTRRRPADQVRFVGADVVQLRPVQFDELQRYVDHAAPDQGQALARHLWELRIRDNHVRWYREQPAAEQQRLITHARAVQDLVRRVPIEAAAPVSRLDVDLHALALLGFYESSTENGDMQDLRDLYITLIIERWRANDPRPMIYSAAHVHTVAAEKQIISFPPVPALPRKMAGGRLRAALGERYVSIALTFNHGEILAGWHTGQPDVFSVPVPPAGFVDHELGMCRYPDYILPLGRPAPARVRSWLHQDGTLRVIGGAMYDPDRDAEYYTIVPDWSTGFDAILHLRSVSASRML